MTDFETDNLSSEKPNPSAGPHNLYHRQKPKTRLRHRLSGQHFARNAKPSTNAAHEAFTANLKTFSIVALGMGLILLLAMHVQRKSWQIKQNKSQQTREAVTPRPIAHATDMTDHLQQEHRSATSSPKFNAEAMREAVLLTKKGSALQEEGDVQEAITAYRGALEKWPYLTEAWAKLGRLYMQQSDFTRAQRAMEKAVENDPTSADLLNDLGVVYLQQNRANKAITVLQTALDLKPSFALSYFNLALSHLAINNKQKARAFLDQYLAINPNDSRALRETAFLEAAEGHYVQALEIIEQAMSTSPDWPPLHFDAAASAALMGHHEQALRYLQQAVILTSPADVLRIFQEPAFQSIRATKKGEDFAQTLAHQHNEQPNPIKASAKAITTTQPLTSMSTLR